MAHTVFLVEDDQGLREELGTLLTYDISKQPVKR